MSLILALSAAACVVVSVLSVFALVVSDSRRTRLGSAMWLCLCSLALGAYAAMPNTCDTDAECAATRQCLLTPGCDGGPDPAHQPYRWLP